MPASDCKRAPGPRQPAPVVARTSTRPNQGRCVDQSKPVEGSCRFSGRRGCRGEASFGVVPPERRATGRSSPSIPPDRGDEGIHRTGQKTNPSRRREDSGDSHCVAGCLGREGSQLSRTPLAEAQLERLLAETVPVPPVGVTPQDLGNQVTSL